MGYEPATNRASRCHAKVAAATKNCGAKLPGQLPQAGYSASAKRIPSITPL